MEHFPQQKQREIEQFARDNLRENGPGAVWALDPDDLKYWSLSTLEQITKKKPAPKGFGKMSADEKIALALHALLKEVRRYQPEKELALVCTDGNDWYIGRCKYRFT